MDESPVNIESVIRMYDAIMEGNVQQERKKIRDAVKKEADMQVVMKPIADFY